MHSALAKLPEHQQELVKIIGEVRCERGRWPTLDYIERTFRRSTGGDAIATIYALPVVRRPSAPSGYQMVYGENRSIGSPDERVGLTVAGMYHFDALAEEAQHLVRAVRVLANLDMDVTPDPDGVVSFSASIEDVATRAGPLLAHWRGRAPDLAQALDQEPVFAGAVDRARLLVTRSGRDAYLFTGVETVEDYLAQVVRSFGADGQSAPRPTPVSSLALVEALGYLDAVWRARYNQGLLGQARPESAARLAFECSTPEEFDSRLSALADVLKELRVDMVPPKDVSGPLALVLEFLKAKEYSGEAPGRVVDAVATLRAVVAVRSASQHLGASGRLPGAAAQLGLQLPLTNWAAAWAHIKGRCVDALNAVREELQALGQRSPGAG